MEVVIVAAGLAVTGGALAAAPRLSTEVMVGKLELPWLSEGCPVSADEVSVGCLPTYNFSMSALIDQQPIFRTIGKRTSREGRALTEVEVAASRRNGLTVLRAPKGLFFYSSHEEMEADRLRWTVDLIVARNTDSA